MDNPLSPTFKNPDTLLDQATALRQRASDEAADLAHRGAQAVRDRTQHLRETAENASHRTLGYIKDEPVKSMLIAAATGAALMALLSLVNSNRHRR